MKTHLITKNQLDQDNNYIGEVDLENFDGNLESDENLGTVRFKSLNIRGYIYFRKGSGIEAKGDIEARRYIRAGGDIQTGGNIEAFSCITGDGNITAGRNITAYDIVADWGIEAGGNIRAGEDITAGEAIKAGRYITARKIEGVVVSGVIKIIKK